jgi:hypothetical protein
MGFAELRDIGGSIGEDAQVSVSGSSRMGCAYIHYTSAVAAEAAAEEGTDSGCIVVASLAVALPADDGCSSYRLGKRSFPQVYGETLRTAFDFVLGGRVASWCYRGRGFWGLVSKKLVVLGFLYRNICNTQ